MPQLKEIIHPQFLLFTGFIIAFLACFSSCVVPFWMTLTVDARSVNIPVGFQDFRDPEVLAIDVGVWWFCADTGSSVYHCESVDQMLASLEKDYWLRFIQTVAMLNILVTFGCIVIACCRTCCCRCGNNLFNGLAGGFAGICGLVTAGLVIFKLQAKIALVSKDISLSWATYVYACGSALMLLVSSLLRFTPSWTDG